MELVLPSLLLLIVAAIFAYAVIPNFGPLTLAVVSLIALVAVAVHHSYMFETEYRLSTWQKGLGQYSPFIALGLVLLLSIGFLLQMYSWGTGVTSARSNTPIPPPIAEQPTILEQATNMAQNAIKSMPSVDQIKNMTVNPITAAVNRGLNAVGITNTAGAPAPAAPAKPPSNLPFSPSEV